jgi:hypothetical protein
MLGVQTGRLLIFIGTHHFGILPADDDFLAYEAGASFSLKAISGGS